MVGVESVWDYPRPPGLERCGERVRVVFAGRSIAELDNRVSGAGDQSSTDVLHSTVGRAGRVSGADHSPAVV